MAFVTQYVEQVSVTTAVRPSWEASSPGSCSLQTTPPGAVAEQVGRGVADPGGCALLHLGVINEEPAGGRLVEAVCRVMTAVLAAVVFHHPVQVVDHAVRIRVRTDH